MKRLERLSHAVILRILRTGIIVYAAMMVLECQYLL
jgi:hypothetical protein